ncbi:STAS domain-containing protein [Streptomyces rectiviolaceus]|uniref:STAS domain-containing protein n=1 Tax=Streptomyces rectiviolaceus TaxID=332591 RepID=A0ABP6MBA5_9ACTN
MQDDTDPRLVLRPVQASPYAVMICLSGELDSHTTVLLSEVIAQTASRRDDHTRLLLDLSALTYCDNAGLFTLLGICQALNAVGINISIPWTGTIADEAIALAGLQHRLPLRAQ